VTKGGAVNTLGLALMISAQVQDAIECSECVNARFLSTADDLNRPF
jgi:hypothetical protein